MDKIKQLNARRKALYEAGKAIRKDIAALVDEDSFVELSAFSFSHSDFYGEDAEGEGVVCGFATIDDSPFYIVAQNPDVFSGGVSKGGCEKICKTLDAAEKSGTSVIYILSSLGVRIGEGVSVLEGISALLKRAACLKGEVVQYLIVNGEVYGQIALLAGICDFTFFADKKSVLALNSPLVISAANGKNVSKLEVGGAKALAPSQLVTFNLASLSEIKEKIKALNVLLELRTAECEDLNTPLPKLNKSCGSADILTVFDKNTVIEFGAGYESMVKCVLARLGGITVSATIFDGGKSGVKLTPSVINKLNQFAHFAYLCELPYITFVNTLGMSEDEQTLNSTAVRDLTDYISLLGEMDDAKLAVVYGKAVGLGYTVFAAKSMGYDYSCALASAHIALFDGMQGAEIQLSADKKAKYADTSKLSKQYSEENADPINAAKCGYIDDVIEPQFLRQYLIAALQMLIA